MPAPLSSAASRLALSPASLLSLKRFAAALEAARSCAACSTRVTTLRSGAPKTCGQMHSRKIAPRFPRARRALLSRNKVTVVCHSRGISRERTCSTCVKFCSTCEESSPPCSTCVKMLEMPCPRKVSLTLYHLLIIAASQSGALAQCAASPKSCSDSTWSGVTKVAGFPSYATRCFIYAAPANPTALVLWLGGDGKWPGSKAYSNTDVFQKSLHENATVLAPFAKGTAVRSAQKSSKRSCRAPATRPRSLTLLSPCSFVHTSGRTPAPCASPAR